MNISIGIPTFNRPKLLLEALQSCLNQTYQPKEIIIGDDSSNHQTKHLIEKFILENSPAVYINYYKNISTLGQGENVNKLIENVQYEKFVLLHDDDLLNPEALQIFVSECSKVKDVSVIYGKQRLINEKGKVLDSKTESINRMTCRTEEEVRNPLNSLEAAIVQQLPNNAFFIDTSCFKRVKYFIKSRTKEVGTAVDFDFGLRLALEGFKFRFINVYTACYRATLNSISQNPNDNAALKAFYILNSLADNNCYNEKYKEQRLKYLAPVAFMQACNARLLNEATCICFSRWHRKRILSLGGGNRLLHLLLFYAGLF